jgi:hypothetical protein
MGFLGQILMLLKVLANMPDPGAATVVVVIFANHSLVRTTRARIIVLRNDYKEHMAVVEKFLHEHFANLDDDAPEPASLLSTGAARPATESHVLQEPFAKVNTVAEGSPAQSAGLQPGDEIRVFGYVDRSNHDNLKRVGECVQGNEDVSYLSQPVVSSGCAEPGHLCEKSLN